MECLSNILRKATFRKLDLCLSSRELFDTPTPLRPLNIAVINQLTLRLTVLNGNRSSCRKVMFLGVADDRKLPKTS
jgi:hypothetical protein